MCKNRCRKIWRKILVIVFLICLLAFCFWKIGLITFYSVPEKGALSCYNLSGNRVPELNFDEPKWGSAIYFHETSCPKNLSDISLQARQSCSVESTLRANPTTDVFLLISSPIFRALEETQNIFVKELLKYPNFKLRHINFSKYLSNTGLKKIQTSGGLNSSQWPVSHASDILRYATLYKFGGIYMDLDFIVMKPLPIFTNFVGAESYESLGSGIIGINNDKIGREVATACIEDLSSSYRGNNWGNNGPGVITRVLKKRCGTPVISKMFKSYCGGFRVYPTLLFYPLPYTVPRLFFEEGKTNKIRPYLSHSFAVHYWNKLTSNYVFANKLDIPFIFYAKQHCPKIYNAAKGKF